MLIRPARADDKGPVLSIIRPVIERGETYPLDRDMADGEILAYWFAADKSVFVAEDDDAILGTYYIKPNQAGGGRHVCNCGYITAGEAIGRGVARRMCGHSLDRARSLGYRAMQFNFVVSTNERAVKLWHSIGFRTVGTLPLAFEHPSHGLVDALVMFQKL